jgi:hypothetical protein
MKVTNMNVTTLTRRLALLPAVLAVAAPLAVITPAQAGSNMAKVDIVAEGIDTAPIYVDSRSSGYTGSEQKAHKYMVRVFAKAAGQNRVWKVKVFGIGKNNSLFEKNVGRSEGWEVYGKSLEVFAKPGSLSWMTTPKTACDNLMKQKMAEGMTKQQVLSKDQKTTALAFVGFSAWADSKANNKKGKHDSHQGGYDHHDNTAYQVRVVCRAAL